ncbi:MAG: hypothetical protein HFH09_04070 [Bacilli bacterium]|nr:hypothetical protein [Bacilli bacterium]
MASSEAKKITELSKPKATPSLLSYEEYYDALMLAKKIRLENANELSNAKTPKEKTNILEQLFIQYNIPSSSSSPKDKELATLLKINIFIPDNGQFIMDYTKFKKNVRLIAEDYQIPAPFVFQKVAEIGKYEQYLEQIKKEGGLKEPQLEDNSTLGIISTLASSGTLKPLYDPTTPKTTEEKKKKKKRTTTSDHKSSVAKQESASVEAAQIQPTIYNPATLPTAIGGIVSEELLHHLDSMQRYCTRLLDQNEQLGSNNETLKKLNKDLEDLLRRLKLENGGLKDQLASATSEKKDLEAKITALTEEKLALTTQAVETTSRSRTLADETVIERELRQEIAELRCTNQELSDQLEAEKDKKYNYRNRAVVAEAQLEQLQHGMQGIFQEVDALDISFTESTTKRS